MIWQTLQERGFVADSTAGLKEALAGKPTFYFGIDPTADSLHIGHLLPLMMAAWLQKAGCKPIMLVGGGTGLIGDPSGKSKERPLLSEEKIAQNVTALKEQISQLLDFSGDNKAVMVDNADWLVEFGLTEFLRDIGKHFTVNEMMSKESIKARFENRRQGISFTEFSYMILQATDFLHLFDEYDCRLQIGGQDQWGNITAGTDLVRKKRGEQAYGLVCPLLTRSDGKKFGKTAAGAVWLDEEQTSPYRLYQYWLNVSDKDVVKLLNLYTFLPQEEIDKAKEKLAKNPQERFAQKLLAKEFVTLVHGESTAENVASAARFLFGEPMTELDQGAIDCLRQEVESTVVKAQQLGEILLSEALVELGLVDSNNAARRLIKQGGAYINNEKVTEDRVIESEDLAKDRIILLRAGKKRYGLLEKVS